ncbi:hypothetical protein GCM10011487_20100 [Steroidobacter agaridevorans]|uniref:Uncharacterized protein n=1 Tax=Steroidobacter agaridevorans TaxID=2695856 RepID=A0A829YA08_9GAMM|nr:hypothetical protein GCM10011487_20100 [Steroidobacter agaridevorans]GFE90020.1 hypothetical protein GCM10011488_49740 [Steroidobacter agaridevorans]
MLERSQVRIAGAVHQHVQPAEFFDRNLHGRSRRVLVDHVEIDQNYPAFVMFLQAEEAFRAPCSGNYVRAALES